MRESPKTSDWTRHLVYRSEHTRTTWKLRFGLAALLILAFWLTSQWWTVAIARSLTCAASVAPSDAILVDTLDYRLFDRARELLRAGLAPRVLVSTPTDPSSRESNAATVGAVELLARLSHVGTVDIVPVGLVEPISLNAARDVQRFVEREHIRSLIVVTPLFRSRRSALVYAATLDRAGIAVRCDPVEGSVGVNSWTRSWHGIQGVVEEWLKLQYYRLYILPFHS